MTQNLNPYSRDAYRAIWDSQSGEFRECIELRLRAILDAYLTSVGEASNYAEYKRFASTLVDAVLMYIIADEWVTLSDKAISETRGADFPPVNYPDTSTLDLSVTEDGL